MSGTPIIFEPFDAGDGGDGSGDATQTLQPLQAFAFAGAANIGRSFLAKLTAYAPGVITRTGEVKVYLRPTTYASDELNTAYSRLPLTHCFSRNISLAPNVNLGYGTLPLLLAHAEGVITRMGSAEVTLPFLHNRGLKSTNIGVATLPPLRNYAPEVSSIARFVSIIQSPGWMTAHATGPTVLVYASDSLETTDETDAHFILQILEQLVTSTSTGTWLISTTGVAEFISASDFGALVWQLIVADDLTIAADPLAYFDQLIAVADGVFATGAFDTYLNALLYVALIAELGDKAATIDFMSVTDTMSALDTAALERVALMVAALDSMTLSVTADSTLRLTALVSESLTTSDTVGTSLEALIEALEAGLFTGRLSVGGTSYSVYALTLQGQAPSEYTDFDFDSYATIGGVLYAVGPQGFVRCDGDTDDGANINAEVRKGLSTLGTELKKQVPYAYIGYTSTGSLVLETTTTDKRTKRVNRYKLSPIATPAFSDGRFKIAQGLQATYWDFTLKNLEGADFEVDFVKVWRLPLSRRK